MSVRRLVISSARFSTPVSTARAAPRSLPRRAAERPTRRPARLCSVSSCSSRAQRRRSCSEASISRAAAAPRPTCRSPRLAALAANAPTALVLAVEAGFVAEMVEGGEHADGAAAKHERHQQRGVGLEAEQLLRDVQRRAGVGEPLGALDAAPARDGALDRHLLAVGARGQRAGAGRGHEVLLLLEHDHQRRAPDERARPRDDQLEDAARGSFFRRGPARSPPRCRVRARPLEVVAAALDGRVQPRVVDRDRGPVGEVTADSSSAAVNGRPPSFSVR